jgi:hypothetical protein
MTRKKKKSTRSRASDLATFRKLTKADALLFCVIELLRSMDLEDVARSVEPARANIAQRLEVCQDAAYVGMRAKRLAPSRSVGRSDRKQRTRDRL